MGSFFDARNCAPRVTGSLLRFSGTTHDYDVAIIKLSEDIDFNNHIQPACLPDSNTVYEPGKRCFISGWGRTGDGMFNHVICATLATERLLSCRYQISF